MIDKLFTLFSNNNNVHMYYLHGFFSSLRMCVMVDCLFGNHNIRRQIEELERISDVESNALIVDGRNSTGIWFNYLKNNEITTEEEINNITGQLDSTIEDIGFPSPSSNCKYRIG
ncbi:hypothetical protein YC2023_025562 [Brassica napus]